MNNSQTVAPPDQLERIRALDRDRSILVQAPAGSGKTDLLTRRFLRLLGEVDDPGQIVAITFTIAAAAEMRHRIVRELEKAALRNASESVSDPLSMEALARRALLRSQALGWNLLDLPAQLRIDTIDAFCRELALQQPLLAGIGGTLQINPQPSDLYRRAARGALKRLDSSDVALRDSIEALLLLRDNGWKEMEDLLVEMLGKRDRWMQGFVFSGKIDWEELRQNLERPFANAIAAALSHLTELLDRVPGACEEVLELARFACAESGRTLHNELAELAEFPCAPFAHSDALEDARNVHVALAKLLLTNDGALRKRVDVSNGFPPDGKLEKARLMNVIASLRNVDGFEAALAAVRDLPPTRYPEEEWKIVRACFALLRQAAAELKTVFAETGTVDFIEVAQIAQQVLRNNDGFPSDPALAVADGIRHLLVDEFQDTSRRQHQLIASLIAAWPDSAGRTLFVVGDPMQSIYGFRDADAELFPRVRERGLELHDGSSQLLDSVRLTANFRTDPGLVEQLNIDFERIFSLPDGSNIEFARAEAARDLIPSPSPRLQLHLEFMPDTIRANSSDPGTAQLRKETSGQRDAALDSQTANIVDLIRSHADRMETARLHRQKYRVAVLGRTKAVLAPIAMALRKSKIPFRAIELENLADRPEILDALSIARALVNPQDRVAWLGVLRAPWCGLSLQDLHSIAGDGPANQPAQPIPDLLTQRRDRLSPESQLAVDRVLNAFGSVPRLRAALPTSTVGTLLEQIWLSLGGHFCVDATARANLNLLWRSLDQLPNGEQDLLSPALNTAIQNLCALPDPSSDSECGVQLMTIHKSKGLEFEVVIVPELQARTRGGEKKLLSWLERGVADPDDTGEITEFLIAPLPTKGADKGNAKAWVDRVCRVRESQEMRRLLYVASTRAREELHLFARPAYKREKDGSRTLCNPSNCLLATAWPAFEDEVRQRFQQWIESASTETSYSNILASIAASGENNLLTMPAPAKPTQLRRLPADFQSPVIAGLSGNYATQELIGAGQDQARPYLRHEGSMLSRALGNAVHKLLEDLAHLRLTLDWPEARVALEGMRPRIVSLIRAAGVPSSQASSMAEEAFQCALRASQDAQGQWILSPHNEASSESGWAGVVSGDLRVIRVDRLFRAGPEPGSPDDHAWWIIDYKTAHADGLDPAAALPEFRAAFAPQLEIYAALLRNRHGADAQFRAGLYYPRMSLLDWWEIS